MTHFGFLCDLFLFVLAWHFTQDLVRAVAVAGAAHPAVLAEGAVAPAEVVVALVVALAVALVEAAEAVEAAVVVVA